MDGIVSITSQGQLTIPVSIRKYFDIKGSVKAVIRRVNNVIIVEPRTNFWSLKGSLSSSVKLSDKQLKEARDEFSKKWAKP